MVNAIADVLTAILDFTTQLSVFSFTKGLEFDQSYTLTGATVAVEGRDYGYDALGPSAAPVAPRKTSWKFVHLYAVGETYTGLKDAMTLAFGHGRPIYLQKVRPDGTVLIAEARLDSFPDKATVDTMTHAEFTVTFQQRGDWMAKDVTSPRYDTGAHYDAGTRYDQRGVLYLLTGVATSFTLINSGTVNERDGTIRFDGPIDGPLQLQNASCDVHGVPFPPGVSGQPMQLTVATSLALGESLIIYCRTDTFVTNKVGVVPWALVTKAPGQTFLFELVPGNNNCTLAKADALGVVSGAILTGAGHYSVAPTGIAFSGGGGTGATATFTTSGVSPNITVTSVTIGNIGGGYSSAPTMTFTGGTGTAATATAVVSQGAFYAQFKSRWRS